MSIIKVDDWYEKQYIPSFWSKKHPNRKETLNHFLSIQTDHSNHVKSNVACRLGISYGNTENQKIDYFYSSSKKINENNYPILIYIHGGFWQEGDRSLYSNVAKSFTDLGFTVAVVGYDLAPTVRIQDIINQVKSCVRFILSDLSTEVILIGHSAGAYLSAAISTEVDVAGCVLISGIYDLKPLLKTTINYPLKLTNEDVTVLNDVILKERLKVKKVLVCVGEDESPEFQDQSKWFNEKLLENNVDSEFLTLENQDHFSIVENLYYTTFSLVKIIAEFAKEL